MGQRKCELRPTRAMFNDEDPCPGKHKHLLVRARCSAPSGGDLDSVHIPEMPIIHVEPITDICRPDLVHLVFCTSGLFRSTIAAINSIIATSKNPQRIFFHIMTDDKFQEVFANLKREYSSPTSPDRSHSRPDPRPQDLDLMFGDYALPSMVHPPHEGQTDNEIATTHVRSILQLYTGTPNVNVTHFKRDGLRDIIRTPGEARSVSNSRSAFWLMITSAHAF